MRTISVKLSFLLILALISALQVCEAQPNKKYVRNPEKALFGKSLHTRDKKIREPRSVVKAKKKQEKAAKKKDKEYAAYVKKNRKHSLEIQSPEVRSRITNNMKQSENNYVLKKKKESRNSRKAGKKYDR